MVHKESLSIAKKTIFTTAYLTQDYVLREITTQLNHTSTQCGFYKKRTHRCIATRRGTHKRAVVIYKWIAMLVSVNSRFPNVMDILTLVVFNLWLATKRSQSLNKLTKLIHYE